MLVELISNYDCRAPVSRFSVRVGSSDCTKGGQTIEVCSIHVPDTYGDADDEDDIAILQVKAVNIVIC